MTEISTDGIGMAAQNMAEHQGCQRDIFINMAFAHPTFKNRLATETNVFDDDSKTKRAPDISFWKSFKRVGRGKYLKKELLMTIEITHSNKNFAYSERSILEIFALIESIRESFIYDYEMDEWTRYRRMPGGEIKKYEKCSYSNVIKEDLAQYL